MNVVALPIAEDNQETWDNLEKKAAELRNSVNGSPMATDPEHVGYDVYGYYVWVWHKGAVDNCKKIMIRVIEHDGVFRYCVGDKQFRSAQSAITATSAL